MRKILKVFGLKHELHLPERAIAATCGIARSSVQELFSRFHASIPRDIPKSTAPYCATRIAGKHWRYFSLGELGRRALERSIREER